MHINGVLRECTIDADCWFTIETLGYQTEVEENINSGSIIMAPDDWRPSPLKS